MIGGSKYLGFAAILASGMLMASAAKAGTDVKPLTVTAKVIASCVLTVSPLAFGDVTLIAGTAIDETVTNGISVTCSAGAGYTIGISVGLGSGATLPTRKMTSGANTLNYQIYSDAPGGASWGDTSGTGWVSDTGTGSAQNKTYYGRILASQQTVPIGDYEDTVQVTVTF